MQASGSKSIQGFDEMARTIRTVERRLGVDPDKYIVYHFICPECWARHHPDELEELISPICGAPGCKGRLYHIKRVARGFKRVPNKVLSTCPIIPQLQRILRRPGKYEEFQHWRREGDAADEPGRGAPDSSKGYEAFPDPKFRLNDVSDGWAWRAVQAGLSRRRGRQSEVEDVDTSNLNQRFVKLPNGLLLMINIDWYVVCV